MGIVYPGSPPGSSQDVFTVPSSPESTPLSEAGTGTRNLVESVQDQGAAIEALESWATLRTHDHSGDGTQVGRGAKLAQANTHQSADTDVAVGSIHHTIDPTGLSPTAAAAANHTHTYAQIQSTPYQRCTSLSRPTSPQPGDVIFESDTNRARVWAAFPNNSIANGLYSVDYFPRTSSVNLDPTLWSQTYTLTSPSNGTMATPTAGVVSWIPTGNSANTCVARRINSADDVTVTDDQVVTWTTGASFIQTQIFNPTSPSNDAYLRMSADQNSYIRVQVQYQAITISYSTTGASGEKVLNTFNTSQPNTFQATWRAQVQDRTITVACNGETLFTVVDSSNVTMKGASNRGWGIGMHVAPGVLSGQILPANVLWISISDVISYTSINRWSLMSWASVPSLRLRGSQRQQFLSTGTIVNWSSVLEDSFGYYNTAAPTDIRIQEPGLYHLDIAVQWDTQIVPDVGILNLVVNGANVDLRNQEYLRGNTYNPGFSQTIAFSGKWRFAANDVMQIGVSYQVNSGLLNEIFSFFDINNAINSRLDMVYLSP